VLAAAALAALAVAYAEVFAALGMTWWSSPMYSYGVLIPVISLYLVWSRRERLRGLEAGPSHKAGWPVLATGLAALVIGKAGGVIVVQELSLIPTIAGVVLLVLGWPFLKALWAPIAYLIFMIPVWDGLTERLHAPFQNFSAENGLWLLQMVGIPAHRDGVFLELPHLTLEVARACSGVNYLIAILAIGFPLAVLYVRGWGRKTILLCSAVAVAIAANSLRVALIGILAYYEVGSPLHGPFHVLQGLFVSMVGYGALFGGLWVLSRGRLSAPQATSRVTCGHSLSRPVNRVGVLVVLVGVLTGLVGYVVAAEPRPVALRTNLAEFPRDLGGWADEAIEAGAGVPFSLKPDNELRRKYRTASGERVDVYIGYLASQTQGKELMNYRTAEIHRGAFLVELPVPGVGRTVVNAVIRSDHGRSYVALFWYALNGRVVTDRYWGKAYTIWDALAFGQTNGAIVWITADLDGPEGRERVLATLTRFAGTFYPEFDRALSVSGDAAVKHEGRGES
jgi:EpsI family protein